jgi:Rifampin ADP-ribosyl transferase
MAAHHNLGPQFFHGTVSNPSGEITPVASSSWRKPMFPSDTDVNFAYATTDESNAWNYAERAWHSRGQGVPKVFKVEPMGEHEEDPTHTPEGVSRGNFSGDRRSRQGWRIIGERPMPEHMGDPEDWR